MNQTNISADGTNQQVYGFLCPKTNVFYAFDSYEVYQQFLQWLAQQDSQAGQQPQPI